MAAAAVAAASGGGRDCPSLMVSVLGLTRARGQLFNEAAGVGKSCVCFRFMHPAYDDYIEQHPSLLALHEFESDVIKSQHSLYWGCTTECYPAKGRDVIIQFHVVEQTVFYQDITSQPFTIVTKPDGVEAYSRRVCASSGDVSAGKLSYKTRDGISLLDDDYRRQPFPLSASKLPRGFLVVLDVSQEDEAFDRQLERAEQLLEYLHKHKRKFIIVATKRDYFNPNSLEKLYSVRKKYKTQIIETSSSANLNISNAFRLIAHKVLHKKVQGLSDHVTSYEEAAQMALVQKGAERNSFRNFLRKRVLNPDETISELEYSEQCKTSVKALGKFETEKIYAEHVLEVYNGKVGSYPGVLGDAELRVEFLEDFIDQREDLKMYSHNLKRWIERYLSEHPECSPASSPELPLSSAESALLTAARKDDSYQVFEKHDSGCPTDSRTSFDRDEEYSDSWDTCSEHSYENYDPTNPLPAAASLEHTPPSAYEDTVPMAVEPSPLTSAPRVSEEPQQVTLEAGDTLEYINFHPNTPENVVLISGDVTAASPSVTPPLSRSSPDILERARQLSKQMGGVADQPTPPPSAQSEPATVTSSVHAARPSEKTMGSVTAASSIHNRAQLLQELLQGSASQQEDGSQLSETDPKKAAPRPIPPDTPAKPRLDPNKAVDVCQSSSSLSSPLAESETPSSAETEAGTAEHTPAQTLPVGNPPSGGESDAAGARVHSPKLPKLREKVAMKRERERQQQQLPTLEAPPTQPHSLPPKLPPKVPPKLSKTPEVLDDHTPPPLPPPLVDVEILSTPSPDDTPALDSSDSQAAAAAAAGSFEGSEEEGEAPPVPLRTMESLTEVSLPQAPAARHPSPTTSEKTSTAKTVKAISSSPTSKKPSSTGIGRLKSYQKVMLEILTKPLKVDSSTSDVGALRKSEPPLRRGDSPLSASFQASKEPVAPRFLNMKERPLPAQPYVIDDPDLPLHDADDYELVDHSNLLLCARSTSVKRAQSFQSKVAHKTDLDSHFRSRRYPSPPASRSLAPARAVPGRQLSLDDGYENSDEFPTPTVMRGRPLPATPPSRPPPLTNLDYDYPDVRGVGFFRTLPARGLAGKRHTPTAASLFPAKQPAKPDTALPQKKAPRPVSTVDDYVPMNSVYDDSYINWETINSNQLAHATMLQGKPAASGSRRYSMDDLSVYINLPVPASNKPQPLPARQLVGVASPSERSQLPSQSGDAKPKPAPRKSRASGLQKAKATSLDSAAAVKPMAAGVGHAAAAYPQTTVLLPEDRPTPKQRSSRQPPKASPRPSNYSNTHSLDEYCDAGPGVGSSSLPLDTGSYFEEASSSSDLVAAALTRGSSDQRLPPRNVKRRVS